MGAFIDLSGQKFGRLTVVRRAPNKDNATMWECICSCDGKTVIVSGSHLKDGHTTSCGCVHKEDVSKRSRIDLTGRVFGHLTVLEYVGNDIHNNALWKCQCDCPAKTIKVVAATQLLSGKTKSCGCYRAEILATSKKKYDDADTKYLAIKKFGSMKYRCGNSGAKEFPNYGGRGIEVCEEWKKDPAAFARWAKEHGYKKGLSIDRIDNNRGYSPDNCRFTTDEVQANNKRNNRHIVIDGIDKTIAQWARDLNLDPDNMYQKTESNIIKYIKQHMK